MHRTARRFPARTRAGFTLIELLVSMTITLIMVYSLVQFMVYISTYVSEGRGQIEMAGSIRGVRALLYKDLQMATVFLRPAPGNDNASGGVEVSEGHRSDADPRAQYATDALNPEVNRIATDRDLNGTADILEGKGPTLGDCDDRLWLTARSSGEPYVGLFATSTVTSDLAEILWFTSHFQFDGAGNVTASLTDAIRPECTLYRRALLIRPDLNGRNPSTGAMDQFDTDTQTYYLYKLRGSVYTTAAAAHTALVSFWQNNDISATVVEKSYPGMMGTQYKYLLVANSLSDLSRREARFAHNISFPGQLSFTPDDSASLQLYILGGARIGQDIVLSHVTAFDLRVYDPSAIVRRDSSNTTSLVPGDPGYTATGVVDIGTGAFVDLGYQRFVNLTLAPTSLTAAQANALPFYQPVKTIKNATPAAPAANYMHDPLSQLFCTYDSWSFSYEHDGLNQDGDSTTVGMTTTPLVDEGTDGLDNDNTNGVDDPGERETLPPYPVVLPGLQIRIRIYDHSIRLGRQATVVTEFNR